MPLKRRVSKTNPHRITAEVVAAYLAGDLTALHVSLKWPPWLPSPLDVDDGDCPDFIQPERWAQAVEARAAIVDAMTPAQLRRLEANE